MLVIADHVGYRPRSTKRLLVEAPAATKWRSLSVVRLPSCDHVVDVGAEFAGAVDGWSCGPWWTVDVSDLTEPGRYALRWSADASEGQSEGFTISADAHGDQLVSDIVHYIKGQRCSGIWDAADRAAPRVGDGERRDVHGGWYDASGDYSKYLSHLSYANFMNPQQTPLVVWTLARAWQRYRRRGDDSLLVERIRDEALHGADWLMRMQDAEGFWYVTLFDRWTRDPAQRELCSYRTQLGHKGDDYEAGWRQGGGMAVAALALASTLGDGPDHSSAQYLAAALRGFDHLREHADDYLDDRRQNLIDDTCALVAACELFAAFGGAAPPAVVEECGVRVNSLVARRRQSGDHVWLSADGDARSWFHASDEGLPGLALLQFAELFPGGPEAAAARQLAAELVKAQLELGGSLDNPFGYPPHWIQRSDGDGRVQWFYPHDNESGYWWQGENARIASLASLALAVAELLSDPDSERLLRGAAERWVSWILGANPFDICMLHGHGRGNPPYEPGFHNAPGGVCNGITSGFDDEGDITFRPMPHAASSTQSWRWGEQWMPHAAWLLSALVWADAGSDDEGDVNSPSSL